MKSTITKEELNQFTGSQQWFRHFSGRLVYTEGVQYIAEKAGAYWLIDLIASYQPIQTEEFQFWTLRKEGELFVAVCTDGNDNELVKQVIEYTDFPQEFMPFNLYLCHETLHLPSEY